MEKLATVVFVCFQMWGLDTLFVNVVLLCYIYLFQNIGMHFQALPGSLAMSSYPCTEALKSSWTFCGTLINDCHSFKEWTMLFLSLFFFFLFSFLLLHFHSNPLNSWVWPGRKVSSGKHMLSQSWTTEDDITGGLWMHCEPWGLLMSLHWCLPSGIPDVLK